VVENFGWPCFEGNARQNGYDALNNTPCESLYTTDTSKKPSFSYSQFETILPGGACPSLTAASNGGSGSTTASATTRTSTTVRCSSPTTPGTA